MRARLEPVRTFRRFQSSTLAIREKSRVRSSPPSAQREVIEVPQVDMLLQEAELQEIAGLFKSASALAQFGHDVQEDVGDGDPRPSRARAAGMLCKKSSLLENRCARAITAKSNAVRSSMLSSYPSLTCFIGRGPSRGSGLFRVW